MPTFGKTIIWHDRSGARSSVTVERMESPQRALEECLATAIQFGWTKPKWWQWWRWKDIDHTKNLSQ